MSILDDFDPWALQKIKPAVARLLVVQYATEGTGFLVAPDELLTCCHVVERLAEGDTVQCRFGEETAERTATLVKKNAAADVALLRLAEPVDGVTPLRLAARDQTFTSWVGYGYPAFTDGVGVTLTGGLHDPALRDRDGRAAMQVHTKMLVGENTSLGGFSGTPLLAGGQVVGMLYRVLGAKSDWSATHFGLLYAIPAGVLRDYVEGADIARPSTALKRDDETRHPQLTRLLAELRGAGNATEILSVIQRLRDASLLQRPTLLQAAEQLLDMGAASEVQSLVDGVDDPRASQLSALAHSLRGEHMQAQAILTSLGPSAETGGLSASVLKRRFIETKNRNWLQAAYDQYAATYDATKDPYPGINAAALALWSGDPEKSRSLATEVRARVLEKAEPARGHWDWATLGEAHLLLGEMDAAVTCYRKAVGAQPAATRAIASMRIHARRDLACMARPSNALDDVLAVGAVAWITGHRVDAPGAKPRFPTANVPAVARALRRMVEERQIRFGFGSAASGADLLFMETLLEAGAEATVYLPFAAEDFIATSVGPEWRPRFERVLARLPPSRCIVLNEKTPATETGKNEAYARCNEIVEQETTSLARSLGERPILIAVVVLTEGTAARGGTLEAVRMWQERDIGETLIVNPLTTT